MAYEDCLLNLRGWLPSLRPAEQRVAREVLKNPEEVVHLSITELAKRADVSDATVVKFCKRIGYRGFQDLKIRLAQNVAVRQEPIYGAIEQGDDVGTVKEKVFQMVSEALQDTARTLDDAELNKAVQLIAGARSICFFGVGASGIVANDAHLKFGRIGLNASAHSDSHIQTAFAALLNQHDVAVGISHSGTTREVIYALELARKAQAATIAITNFPQSPIAETADVLLCTSSTETVFRSGAISSRIVQLLTIDTLFLSVALSQYQRSLACLERTREAVTLSGHHKVGTP